MNKPAKSGYAAHGALTNRAGRFEAQHVHYDLSEPPPSRATVYAEPVRTIINHNASKDLAFERSINPYRGCEHGCIYCFARPSHAYLGYSPGLDFETKLHSKPGAARLLRAELTKPNYTPRTIAIGTNTDPYQPIEKSGRIMRSLLEVFAEFNHPVTIVTKGSLIMQDIDILNYLARRQLVSVGISVTTLDHRLSRKMEPKATSPKRRLEIIGTMSANGIPVRAMLAPMIPKLNDHELETILEQTASAGATTAGYITLRLPGEVKELFQEWLEAYYPERAGRILRHVRELHGSTLYDPRFGHRMKGRGVFAELIEARFEKACKRLGLNITPHKLRTDLFTGGKNAQLSLF